MIFMFLECKHALFFYPHGYRYLFHDLSQEKDNFYYIDRSKSIENSAPAECSRDCERLYWDWILSKSLEHTFWDTL